MDKKREWNVGGSSELITREVNELKGPRGKNKSAWVHEQVLRMTNGEIIIYEYQHGRYDHFPPHLLLARTSDGRWLYSSYIFATA